MSGAFQWQGQPIPFRSGETVATALLRAGVQSLGLAPTGQVRAVFCGIGQCQGCLILHNGRTTEACLLPCRDGMEVAPTETASNIAAEGDAA